MDDESTEALIRRNRALLALAATARANAREAVARAADRAATIRQSRIGKKRALFHELVRRVRERG